MAELPEEKKVFVKLHARCLVDSQIREAGETVLIADVIADSFGERVPVKGFEEKERKNKS